MKPLIILGAAGTIGRVIAWDWIQSSAHHRVILVDRDIASLARLVWQLGPRSSALSLDLTDKHKLTQTLELGSLVINSTSHHFNLPVMEAALKGHCHYLDLGGLFHFTRRQLKLHPDFADAGLTAILGMGCAPGLTNLMAKELTSEWEEVHSIDIRIAGVEHNPPANTGSVPYAFRTLLEELTLKPALFDRGKWTFVQPRSGSETYTFPTPVGSQDLFYTLHSEVATLPHYFKSRGIQHVSFRIGLDPGLCQSILQRSQSPVSPLKKKAPHDEEIALVEAVGKKKGQQIRACMNCLTQSRSEWSAGDLNTACPASAVAAQIMNQTITAPGVHPPENIVPWIPLRRSLDERGFIFTTIRDKLPPAPISPTVNDLASTIRK